MMENASSPLDPARLEGQILQNTYRVEELVGEGGMALVYRATHTVLEGPVAVKVLRSEYYRRDEHRERFLREARSQFHLNHPNIVRVFDFLQDRGIVGFAQEWCNQGDLKQWLNSRTAPCSAGEVRSLFLPLLDGLEEAHRQGLIHRDIKPHNILLQRKGAELLLKLNDFGLVKVLEADDMTRSGVMMGTLHYMSPEQFEEAKHVDHRSDIYSLGVLLYQLMTLRLPFSGKMPHLALKIMNQEPSPPTEAPEPLRPVLLKCLAKKPSARFEDVSAFREALLLTLEQTAEDDAPASAHKVQPRPAFLDRTEPPAPQAPLPSASSAPPSSGASNGSWEPTVVTQTEESVHIDPSADKRLLSGNTRMLGVLVLLTVLVFGGGWLGQLLWKSGVFPRSTKRATSPKPRSRKKPRRWSSWEKRYLGGFRMLDAIKTIQRGDYGLSRYQLRHICRVGQSGLACFHAAQYTHHLMYFLRKGCSVRDVTSCHWEKVLTKRGRTLQQNFQRAIPWYRKACQLGHKAGCEVLKKNKVHLKGR
ncbi:MAG: serine/threonine protein kinase [Deltaproteobacteria bacterium]|nr:MAG: serine/threonine protein kinase [Deltaproteobacteria bacterium]